MTAKSWFGPGLAIGSLWWGVLIHPSPAAIVVAAVACFFGGMWFVHYTE